MPNTCVLQEQQAALFAWQTHVWNLEQQKNAANGQGPAGPNFGRHGKKSKSWLMSFRNIVFLQPG